ncbi:hypothetical protein QPM17_23565, partial [Marinobacter sp. TBZ242]
MHYPSPHQKYGVSRANSVDPAECRHDEQSASLAATMHENASRLDELISEFVLGNAPAQPL